MSYTLAGLRNRILVDKLDDEDFDTQVLDNFINDAQRDIFSEFELPFTEKIFTGALPQGAYMFQFPDDVSHLQSLIITDLDGKSVNIKDKFMDFQTFNGQYASPSTNEAGSVMYWTIFGNKMVTSRPIDGDYTMTIYYNKVPKTLVQDSDVPEVPEEFEEALLLGAFYRVQYREGDADEGLLTKSEFRQKLEQMANRYGFRVGGGPIRMKNRQVGR